MNRRQGTIVRNGDRGRGDLFKSTDFSLYYILYFSRMLVLSLCTEFKTSWFGFLDTS